MTRSRNQRKPPRRLSFESLEVRAVPAVVPFAEVLPIDRNTEIDIATTANGLRVVGLGGYEPIVHELDLSGDIVGTIRLSPPPMFTSALVSAISSDGQWVAGSAYQSHAAINLSLSHAWNLARPDQPIEFDDLDPAIQRLFSTIVASDDGRVVASEVATPTGSAAAILVDGELQELRTPEGGPWVGNVDFIVNGLGGDPTRWIAIGNEYGTSTQFPTLIAFSDGTVQRLTDFVKQQAGPDNSIAVSFLIDVEVSHDSIFFVGAKYFDHCAGKNTCSLMLIQTGFNLTGLPLPVEWTRSPIDVSGDGQISPADALSVIDALNSQLAAGILDGSLPPGANSTRLDVNTDGFLTAADPLAIIDYLNYMPPAAALSTSAAATAAEGESSPTADSSNLSALAADLLFQDLATPRRTRTGPSF